MLVVISGQKQVPLCNDRCMMYESARFAIAREVYGTCLLCVTLIMWLIPSLFVLISEKSNSNLD